jgi:choline-sulfatase
VRDLDLLGEADINHLGLWFKMNFFEGAARVPLMICAPGVASAVIDTPVSTIDITPTLADLAGVPMDEIAPWTDGESLVPLLKGGTRTSPVAMEYAAEGSIAPMIALRDGPWKLIRCAADPDLLFNLDDDPRERHNLAPDPAHAETLGRLSAEMDRRWRLADYDAAVRESQARRWIVYEALRNGNYYPWDHQPLQRASERYMRNHMDLNVLEESKRFPRGD